MPAYGGREITNIFPLSLWMENNFSPVLARRAPTVGNIPHSASSLLVPWALEKVFSQLVISGGANSSRGRETFVSFDTSSSKLFIFSIYPVKKTIQFILYTGLYILVVNLLNSQWWRSQNYTSKQTMLMFSTTKKAKNLKWGIWKLQKRCSGSLTPKLYPLSKVLSIFKSLPGFSSVRNQRMPATIPYTVLRINIPWKVSVPLLQAFLTKTCFDSSSVIFSWYWMQSQQFKCLGL